MRWGKFFDAYIAYPHQVDSKREIPSILREVNIGKIYKNNAEKYILPE
jgi:hypothetical protein